MNTLTLQATFCGLLHGLGKLAFRADKTAAGLLADLPDTPEWAAVRGGAAAGSDAARCAAFARSLSVTADTPAAEPVSSRCRPLRSIFSHLNGEHPGYSVPAARPDGALHDPVQDAPDIPAAVYRELYQELTGQLTGLQFSPAQANALLGLLESQCSALPASTAREEDRDISLYDQLKLTAALAACVSEYLQQADAFSLLEAIAEFSRFYQDAFLSHFPQGHPVANIPDTPHLILGGGTGFLSKTVGYPYLKDDYAAALFKSRCSCSMHPCRHSYRVGPSH